MSNGNSGVASLQHPMQRLIDKRLGLSVQSRGRLVEDQDIGVLEEGAGDR